MSAQRSTEPHHNKTNGQNHILWQKRERIVELEDDMATLYWQSKKARNPKARRAYIFLAKTIDEVLRKMEKSV